MEAASSLPSFFFAETATRAGATCSRHLFFAVSERSRLALSRCSHRCNRAVISLQTVESRGIAGLPSTCDAQALLCNSFSAPAFLNGISASYTLLFATVNRARAGIPIGCTADCTRKARESNPNPDEAGIHWWRQAEAASQEWRTICWWVRPCVAHIN